MSAAEDNLAAEMRWLKMPQPAREHTFAKPRRWRFDFAWPDHMLAVEVEGGSWIGGAHTRGAHFASDCTKYNEAALLGWRVLRVTPEQITSGEASDWITRALAVNHCCYEYMESVRCERHAHPA